jgi:DnaK suppressor protein
MNPNRLKGYRAALEAQLADLKLAMHEHGAKLDDRRTTDNSTGPDRAPDLESLEVDARVTASERKLTAKIHRALERIDLGTYGLCEACGANIPTARLDAKPSVSLCLGCQAEHEAA